MNSSIDSLRSIRTWLPFLLTVALIVLLQLLPSEVHRLLMLTPESLTWHEVYRWFFAHFIHLGWYHLALNLGGLALVAYMLLGYVRLGEWCLFISLGVFFISFGLLYFELNRGLSYVGFSGILHGCFILAAVKAQFLGIVRRLIIVFIIVGKVVWEQYSGQTDIQTEAMVGGKIATEAHALGTLFSILYFSLQKAWAYYRARSSKNVKMSKADE